MLLIDSICTLVNVIIIDSTQVDLILQVALFGKVIRIISIQAKEKLYHDRDLINAFITLAIEVAPTVNYLFFIDVLTWCGHQKALVACLLSFLSIKDVNSFVKSSSCLYFETLCHCKWEFF